MKFGTEMAFPMGVDSLSIEPILFIVTSVIDFLSTAVSLWLALYLLGRGFPSRITLRGVVVLISLAVFFLGAYINLYNPISGTAALRAVLLTIGLAVWNDLTHKLLTLQSQKMHRWRVAAIYVFGFITITLLLWTRTAFVGEQGNVLWVARMGIQPPYILYGVFQLSAGASILYNFHVGAKVGAGLHSRYFLVASLLAVSTVAYGVLALALTPPMPRLIQDALIFSSITVLGISVARHQTLVERRATLQDFPISALAVFGLSAVYLLIAWQMGFSPIGMILVTVLAVLTHSTYNLVREALDRLRSKDENAFRQELRRLEVDINGSITLQERLQGGLKLLCQILASDGAFVAVPGNAHYTVLASYRSVPTGSTVRLPEEGCSDICPPPSEIANQVAWLVPVLQSGNLVAVLGIGPLKSRLQYTEDDLDLLMETADRIGMIIYLDSHRPVNRDDLRQIAMDVQTHETDLQARSEELLTTLIGHPDPQFVKVVEECLRDLTDVITLGQSALPERLSVSGETHIERGKVVQQQLIQAIELLRPARDCPGEPIPRDWYSYTVLHDAYWEGIPNHHIMAKLYISEGTFHRTRRAAVRSVARVLLEMKTQK